jgi:hypothetical protein
MTYGKLRIAWSVAWGIVAVLLCVLWVRSYSSCDNFAIARLGPMGTSMYGGVQFPGAVGVNSKAPPMLRPTVHRFSGCQFICFEIGKSRRQDIVLLTRGRQLIIPDWSLLLLTAAFAAAPWCMWTKRFSLRALLIATTLFAVVLGLSIWSLR